MSFCIFLYLLLFTCKLVNLRSWCDVSAAHRPDHEFSWEADHAGGNSDSRGWSQRRGQRAGEYKQMFINTLLRLVGFLQSYFQSYSLVETIYVRTEFFILSDAVYPGQHCWWKHSQGPHRVQWWHASESQILHGTQYNMLQQCFHEMLFDVA